MARRSLVPENKEGAKRLAALAKVASRFKSLRPAVDVLTRVKAVPTIFPDIDRALGVGGYPIERFTLVHGPSNHGKTAFTLGLMSSFIALDHFAIYIDAERTTPGDWVRKMMGDRFDAPHFVAQRPATYEQLRKDIREALLTIAKAKEDGEIPLDTSAIIVVDSLKKLVPKNLWDEIFGLRAKGEKESGLLRRMGQIQAAMNAAWLMELVPLLEQTNAGFVAIAREMENTDGNEFTPTYKVGGGQDVIFDSSAAMRVERASWIQEGEDKNRKVYGEKHRVTIYKTKIASKEGKVEQAFFHTSNGLLVPEGFDRPRDVIELGLDLGIVKMTGAWLSHEGEKLGQGKHNAVKALHKNSELMKQIEAECRAKFAA